MIKNDDMQIDVYDIDSKFYVFAVMSSWLSFIQTDIWSTHSTFHDILCDKISHSHNLIRDSNFFAYFFFLKCANLELRHQEMKNVFEFIEQIFDENYQHSEN